MAKETLLTLQEQRLGLIHGRWPSRRVNQPAFRPALQHSNPRFPNFRFRVGLLLQKLLRFIIAGRRRGAILSLGFAYSVIEKEIVYE